MKRHCHIAPLTEVKSSEHFTTRQKRDGGSTCESWQSFHFHTCCYWCICCCGARLDGAGGNEGLGERTFWGIVGKNLPRVPFYCSSCGRNESLIWAVNKQRVTDHKCNLFTGAQHSSNAVACFCVFMVWDCSCFPTEILGYEYRGICSSWTSRNIEKFCL